MKNILLIILIFISGIFCSCSFVRNEQVIGKYHISSVDVYDQPCLSYKLEDQYQICIIASKIIAYCKNDHYIFVKQIPAESKDTINVNYYIIPILKDDVEVFPENIVIGPLSEQKFKSKLLKMKIKKIKFKKIQ